MKRLGALLALVFTLGLAWAPPAHASAQRTGRVVLVGVPGLSWADVTPDGTPALAALADRGSVGSLSARTARSRGDALDGWATLSAGNRARVPDSGLPRWPGPDVEVDPVVPLARADNATLDFGAEVGALGDALAGAGLRRAALGRGAVLGLATSGGRVDVLMSGTDDAGTFVRTALEGHAVVAVDVGALASTLAGADAVVGAVVAAIGPDDLVLVFGLDTSRDQPSELRVAIAAGPGHDRGRLRSASTRRAGYVQLIDVAPTVLDVLGVPAPDSMVGQPWRRVGGRHGDEVARLVDAARAADAHRRFVPPFFLILVATQLALYGLAWFAVRRLPRADGRRDLVLGVTRHAAIFFTAAPVATYLAQIVPWWRHPLWFLLLAFAAADAVVVALAYAGPWRRPALGPAGAVAVVTFVVLAADLLTGARLQMSSLAGYSPIVAGRFAGVGNVAFAVFGTSALLATAALCAGRSRRFTLAAVVVSGLVAVVIDGSPLWGSDFGGVIALVPAYAVLGMLLAGARLSWRRLVLAVLGGVLLVTAFAVLDWSRAPDARTHLGRFVAQVLDGGALTIVERKASANLRLLTHSVLTLLVPFAVGFLTLVLFRPRGALRSALDRHPPLRAGLVAALTLGVVGFLANDSGVAVPAWVLTLAVPFALSVSLRSADELP